MSNPPITPTFLIGYAIMSSSINVYLFIISSTFPTLNPSHSCLLLFAIKVLGSSRLVLLDHDRVSTVSRLLFVPSKNKF
ncbi:unnamed protein product [Rhizophagus irregularis]|uniref:Uncharacterized protein n=1 Tax=Rhizophagus irregularis TaxID=588596 RepID=A0A916E2W4_9GLOM|nr:unnamed protein product [Rhizophagus irregularis]CAB4489076.1 unnamed protein product [Rhizophagus irregularis]CAB4489783.1 unnamed protein product [Rhizophagus irregularis]CAB4493092.1 unnamed protein product [Rhizophagus irregularis]CAB5356222.1 unnamed protein product [Rhizophagus irregularis]